MKIVKISGSLALILLLLLLFTVRSEDVETIVNLKIPSQYRIIQQGNPLLVETEVLLVREKPETVIDILIDYTVKDAQDKVITQFSETKGTLLRINTIKEIPIPITAVPGIYSLEVNVSYNGHSSTNIAMFEVVESKKLEPEELRKLEKKFTVAISLFLAAILFFLIFLYYRYRRFKRFERLYTRVSTKDLKNRDIWREKR